MANATAHHEGLRSRPRTVQWHAALSRRRAPTGFRQDTADETLSAPRARDHKVHQLNPKREKLAACVHYLAAQTMQGTAQQGEAVL